MNKFFKYKIALLTTILLLICNSNSYSQWILMKTDADSLVQKGTSHIYNVQFDSARACFSEMIKRYPKHPAGYFMAAMVEWWGMTIHRNEGVFKEDFIEKIDNVIELCDELLDENPTDLTALFFKGGALGYRGRYNTIYDNWFDAALDGKNAYEIMIECRIKAPTNHDIMLGTGIFNYFSSTIPEKYPMAKPFMFLLPPANKSVGLAQLRAASVDSRYSKVEAKVTLLMAYYTFEKNYTEAFKIANDLHTTFPNNPYFHRYLARSYVKLGNWDKLEKEWRLIVKRSIKKMAGYNNKTAREGLYWVGTALKRNGEYDSAIRYFNKCSEVSNYMEDEESGYRLASIYKIALIYYKLKNYKKAKAQFELVLDLPDYHNQHKGAESFLSKIEN